MQGQTLYPGAAFNPGFAGLWFNPFYHARRELYRTVKRLAPQLSGRILDVGCGSNPTRLVFRRRNVGLEIDSPENRANKRADYLYDANVFPFADQGFDSIVCNQVLEHVFTPDCFWGVRGVLKPEGKLFLTVPFIWDEHEQPRDFARFLLRPEESAGEADLLFSSRPTECRYPGAVSTGQCLPVRCL